MPKILQVNLNHCKQAQDLLLQEIAENQIDIAIVAEPYRILDSVSWLSDLKENAAIIWNPSKLRKPCLLVCKGDGYVGVRVGKLFIFSCYISPNKKIADFEMFLQNIALEIPGLHCEYLLVAGDFNAKSQLWGSPRDDIRGETLDAWTCSLDLRLANIGNTPTCIRHNGESIVDLTWVSPNLLDKTYDWLVHMDRETLSDHRYISYTILLEDLENMREDKARLPFRRWVPDKVSADLFRACITLHCMTGCLPMMASLDDWADELTQMMTNACDAAMPTVRTNRHASMHWWNQTISKLRSECIGARRALCRMRRKHKKKYKNLATVQDDPEIRLALETYRTRRKHLRLEIVKSKRAAWHQLIETLQQDPWGMPYKIVLNRMRRASPSTTETLEVMEVERILDELFPNPGFSRRADHQNGDYDITGNEMPDASPSLFITMREVKKALIPNKSIRKAPGPDGITGQILKIVPDIFIDKVTEVFNACFRKGCFPSQWKIARLILIPKNNSPGETKRYRPICLIDEMGKALERLIADRINAHLNNNQDAHLSDRQFGFRKGRSTCDAILTVKNYIKNAKKVEGRCVVAMSIDIKNAFNSLPWPCIVQAMENKRMPRYLVSLVTDYLRDRYITYRDCHGETRKKKILAGVPQGSILGPILWNLTFDQVLKINLPTYCDAVCYADDILVLARATHINDAICKIKLASAMVMHKISNLGLQIATNKTEAVIFNLGNRTRVPTHIEILGDCIEVTRQIKYLGVILDYKLNFKDHFSYTRAKVLKITRALWSLMPNLRGPDQDKRKLYACMINSILLYAAPVWADKLWNFKIYQYKMASAQRSMATRIISAYRTVSYDAAMLLAGIPPLFIMAKRQQNLYANIKALREEGNLTVETKRTAKKTADDWMHAEWLNHLQKDSLSGKRVRLAILPSLREWLNRKSGVLNYHLTQVITGHGSFGSFLFRIGKTDSALCPYCSLEEDTPDHTVIRCLRWNQERASLKGVIGNNLDLQSLITEISKNESSWIALASFARVVMSQKATDEIERQRILREHVLS